MALLKQIIEAIAAQNWGGGNGEKDDEVVLI